MSKAANEATQFERVMFFSDAVFAIAITLLVIEIHPPELYRRSESGLANALLGMIPQYIGFIVSFFVIGRFWTGHHRICGAIARADDKFISINLLFLLLVAFGPFPTALISEYADLKVGVAVYAGWLVLIGLANHRLAVYAKQTPHLWVKGATEQEFTRFLKMSWLPVLLGVSAFILGMIQPMLSLIPLMGSPIIMWVFNKWILDLH
jgi:uncharacterized membrane protein